MLLWTVFTFACVAAVLASEWKGLAWGQWLFKPLASLGFLGAAVTSVTSWDAYSKTMLAAMVLCWLGDVLLIPGKTATFLAGLGTFLLGHVAYGAAFVVRGVDWRWSGLAAVTVMPVLAVVVRWLMPHVKGRMRAPVLAYMTVISCMVALAVGTHGHQPAVILPVAAVAFFASDIAVARRRFVVPGMSSRVWGLPLYYAANLAFASTLQ